MKGIAVLFLHEVHVYQLIWVGQIGVQIEFELTF